MRADTSILVVEDEDIIAENIEDVLDHFGYSLCGRASSGEDAVAMAKQEQPDLILMDINLEGDLDGITAASLIRRELGRPVIFLTSNSDRETLERAAITEPYGYVLKPFREMELRAAIEMALHRSRADGEQAGGQEGQLQPVEIDEETAGIVKVLGRIEPFHLLDERSLAAVARGCRLQKYVGDQYIAFEGEDSSNGLVVVSGRVAMIKRSAKRELVVELLPPGDPFGLFPTIDKQPFSAVLKAQVDSEVLWVPRASVMKVLDQHPEVGRKLISELFARLRNAHNLSRALAHDIVEKRIASTLSALIPRFCEESRSGEDLSYSVDMTRRELADMIGSTQETAIRVTKAMERDGLLDLRTHGVIRIVAADKLRNMADQT